MIKLVAISTPNSTVISNKFELGARLLPRDTSFKSPKHQVFSETLDSGTIKIM